MLAALMKPSAAVRRNSISLLAGCPLMILWRLIIDGSPSGVWLALEPRRWRSAPSDDTAETFPPTAPSPAVSGLPGRELPSWTNREMVRIGRRPTRSLPPSQHRVAESRA
jgi:hypothetical protein